jgi:hypothetical protein
MTETLSQIAVLLAFALVCTFVNLKSRSTTLSLITFGGLIASLAGAAWLIVEWVFL